MTGSETDTKRNGEGDESGADSSRLARFLTPVPRPRSSIPPPAAAPPESTSAAPGNVPEQVVLFADLPVPRRDSSLLPPPGDADAPAEPQPRDEPPPPADIAMTSRATSPEQEIAAQDIARAVAERESRSSDVPLDTSSREEQVEPEPDLGFLPGRGFSVGAAGIRRAAIGAAAVVVSAGIVLMLTRKPSSPKRAPLATTSAAESVPEPKGAAAGETVETADDSELEPLEPSAADVARARDLRREARQLLEAGRAEEGVVVARRAIGADPNHPESYILLAAGLQDLGRWQESRDVFAKCVRESDRKANAECVYFAAGTK
jgi:hypothetical protein